MDSYENRLPPRIRRQQQQQQQQQQQHPQGSQQGPHPTPLRSSNQVDPHYARVYQHPNQVFQQLQQHQQQHSPYQQAPLQDLAAQIHWRQYSHPPQLSLSTAPLPANPQQPAPYSHVSNLHQLHQLQQLRDQQALIWSNGSAAEGIAEANPYRAGCISPIESVNTASATDVERHIQQYQNRLQQPQRRTAGCQPIVPPSRFPSQISPSHTGPRPQSQLASPKSPSCPEQLSTLTPLPSSALVPHFGARSRPSPSPATSFGRPNPYPARTRVQSNSASFSKSPVDAVSSMEAQQSRDPLLATTGSFHQSRSPIITSKPGQPFPTLSAAAAAAAGTLLTAPSSSLDQEEVPLPPQAPISMHYSSVDHLVDNDVNMTKMEDDSPIEVTLNIDIPKSSSPAAAGDPNVTVLSVNPSWHCVFVETVQQQRVRTWVRIQFCPSPLSSTYKDHHSKVLRLRTVQVIGYASRQVELTRRISGQNLLKKGGIIVHLDPSAISFNDASYGFTLSFSSFVAERLCRSNASRPDEPLPLARQQNSAYCRRNLKELYYDTFTKDVIITLKPSGEVFHAHSVVLESYGYFRTLLSRAARDPNMSATEEENEDIGVGSDGSGSQAAVDDEGYARPLNSLPTQRQRRQQSQDDGKSMRSSRLKTKIEIDAAPNLFRAMLHYMYIGHVPTEIDSLSLGNPQRQNGVTSTSSGGGHSVSGRGQPLHSQSTVAAAAATSSPSTSLTLVPCSEPASTPSITSTTAFSWRDLYEIATRFQLAGLMHLSKLVLISRLEADNAVKELFEWAYLHLDLVPCYVSFLIENMDPTLLELGMHRGGESISSATTATVTKSVLWYYHDRCPRFNDIMAVFLRMLNERKETKTLV
ncbi:hypothetical protein BGX26_012030 [Mortierella sp. AD094]|nr:hypothetical protein BGX26_012030 [Mortierella sp. AD094]